jgi:hypothetical protein
MIGIEIGLTVGERRLGFGQVAGSADGGVVGDRIGWISVTGHSSLQYFYFRRGPSQDPRIPRFLLTRSYFMRGSEQ